MKRATILTLTGTLLLVACGEEAPTTTPAVTDHASTTTAAPAASTEPAAAPAASTAPAAPPAARTPGEALAAANAAADRLGSTLRARLLGAMAEGGPARAAVVCADEAQALTRAAATESGARVGRSSLRLRNAADAAPDWVAAWLSEAGERPAAGVVGLAQATETHARVLRPIALEAPCLSCHGDPASLAPEVAAVLHERYPDDRATGYALGDLRGALWAEVDVTP